MDKAIIPNNKQLNIIKIEFGLTIRHKSIPNRNPIKILAKGNCKIFT
jgi:hypothetical protein